jgi:hypothetical protein
MSSLINVLLGTPVLRTVLGSGIRLPVLISYASKHSLALKRTNRRRVATDWVAVAHGALIAELPEA